MAEQFTYADLTYLESMSMGSKEIVVEMIEIFLDQIPEFSDGLQELLRNKDYTALGALAHKAKSSVAVMGMESLAGTLKQLELKTRAGEEIDSYPGLVNDFLLQIQTTEKELRAFIA